MNRDEYKTKEIQGGSENSKLIEAIQRKTGLSIETIKKVVREAGGNGDRLSRLLEEKAKQSPKVILQELVYIMPTIVSRFIASTLGAAATLAFILVIIGASKGIPMGQSLRSIFELWWLYVGFGVFVTIMKIFDKEFWMFPVRRGSPEDPGLADRGYRPRLDKRQMTKEQWKAKYREERKMKRNSQYSAQQIDPTDKQ